MAEAKTKIVIDVSEGAKSLRQLKEEFKQGNKELEGLKVGTKEYVAQIKKLANVKDEIEDLNKAITAFRPDQKLNAFVGAARGVAAGFEAATAASALFGDKAEEVEKTLLKVQSAMALANAVQEVGELGKAFQLLGTVINSAMGKVSQLFKSAIGSTGIGLLVVAIAAIATNWDRIKTAITGVNKEQEENVKLATEAVNRGKERLDDLGIEEKKWKLMGLSQEQIVQKKKEEYAIQQVLLKQQLEANLNLALAQEKAAARNKEILKGILEFSTAPLQAIISGIDYIAEKVSGKKLIDVDLADKLANVIFDPKEAEERTKQIQETYSKNAKSLLDQQLGLELELQNINQQAAKKAEDDLKKKQDRELELQKMHNDALAADEKASEELALIDKQNANNAAETEEQRHQREMAERLNESAMAYEASEKRKSEVELEQAAKRKAIREAELSVAQSVVNGLGSLATIFGEQGKQAVGIQKGLALAQIGIDTARALSGALANSNSPTPDNIATGGLAGIVKYATLVATILANVARAKQILSASTSSIGGGGGGGSSPGFSAPRPPQIGGVSNTNTLLDNSGGGKKEQAPIKAYVVETEISASQKTIQRIEKKSKY